MSVELIHDIYKTSHLLQHNSRKTPNTQFKVGKLKQLEGSKHNLYRKWIHHTKGHFYQDPDYNYSRKCSIAQTGDLEPVIKLRRQHNYVNPAISEYKGNCEGLVDSQPGQSKATQSYVYSRPGLTSERPYGHCVLAHYNRCLNVQVFTVAA